jgi:hypothetical protein
MYPLEDVQEAHGASWRMSWRNFLEDWRIFTPGIPNTGKGTVFERKLNLNVVFWLFTCILAQFYLVVDGSKS